MSQYYFPCVASENVDFQIIHLVILNLNFLKLFHFGSINFTITIASFESKIKDSACECSSVSVSMDKPIPAEIMSPGERHNCFLNRKWTVTIFAVSKFWLSLSFFLKQYLWSPH